MSWEPGNQIDKLKDSRPIYKTLEELEGDLNEEEALKYFGQFLKENITFTTQLISGVKLFPFQHIAIKGMLNVDYFLGIWGRGLSKCECINGLCYTQNGLTKLDDVNIGDYIFSDKSYNLVKNKWYNPEEDGLEITTVGDLKLRAKLGHKLKTLNTDTCKIDYQLIEELKEGQYLPVRLGMNYWPQSVDKNIEDFCNRSNISLEDFWLFCGIIIGDGHTNMSLGRFHVTSEDTEILDFVSNFFRKLGNLGNIINTSNSGNAKTVGAASKELCAIFKYIGFTEDFKSDKKFIPQKLTAAPGNLVAKLLAGLFLTDGYCSTQRKAWSNSLSTTIGYTTICEKMIEQVQYLLLNFGIFSSKHITHHAGAYEIMGIKCNTKTAWCLTIGTYNHLNRFKTLIGFGPLKRKNDLLSQGLSERMYKDDKFGENIPCIGYYLMKKYKRKSFSHLSHRKDGFKIRLDRDISRGKLVKLLSIREIEECDKVLIREILDERYVFKKIKSITPIKVKTLDLTVDNEECYWSNGFVNHNSFSTAVFLLLQALFSPGISIGILSASFRQSKLIVQKILDMTKKPEASILADCITHKTFQTDQWVLEIGQSKIIALPLGDGERIRGFRFQCIVIDEFLLMPEKIHKEVVIPFLGVVTNPTEREEQRIAENQLIRQGLMKEEERYKWPNNKLIALSSASYTFEYLYQVYKSYCDLILRDDCDIPEEERGVSGATRAVMKLSYEFAPEDLYDKSLIQQAKASMSQAQIDREFRSIFTDDSSGYFKIKKMEEVTIKGDEMPCAEIVGDPTAQYILSIDPSWAQSENSDDFAMSIFKINPETKNIIMVHGYAMPGQSLKAHIDYLVYIMQNFNIVFICGDYNGGTQFLQAYNESERVKDLKIQIGNIEGLSFDDPEKYRDEMQQLKNSYNLADRKICFLKFPTSMWIRYANELLAANIDNKKVWFANDPRNVESHYRACVGANVKVNHLKFERGGNLDGDTADKRIELTEACHSNIVNTKVQTALIQISTTAQGSQTFDLPTDLKKQKGSNRPRKDSYSALVLGNFGNKLYQDMNAFTGKVVSGGFVPFLVG